MVVHLLESVLQVVASDQVRKVEVAGTSVVGALSGVLFLVEEVVVHLMGQHARRQPLRSEGECTGLQRRGKNFIEDRSVPGNELLRVGRLWYLHVHTGDKDFRWTKRKAILFPSQHQLMLAEASSGEVSIGLDPLKLPRSTECA